MTSTGKSQRPGQDRDRDEQGRARNARPRDGLGRPLPYDADGVERQPEGVERSPEQTLDDAQRLLEEGKPFHAHEVFEDAWKSTDVESEQALWKGLAQLAVGLTHASRGNARGATALLRRGAENIRPYAERPPHGIDVSGLLGWSDALSGELESGKLPSTPESAAPRLR